MAVGTAKGWRTRPLGRGWGSRHWSPRAWRPRSVSGIELARRHETFAVRARARKRRGGDSLEVCIMTTRVARWWFGFHDAHIIEETRISGATALAGECQPKERRHELNWRTASQEAEGRRGRASGCRYPRTMSAQSGGIVRSTKIIVPRGRQD